MSRNALLDRFAPAPAVAAPETSREGYVMGLRQLVGTRTLLVPGVRGLIFDKHDRVLLQRRGDMALWSLPSGSVELDEDAFGALVREVREETGLEVLSATPFALSSGPQYHFTYPNGDQTQAFALSFVVDEWRGQLIADGVETLYLEFFALDELPENLYEPHRQCLADYQRYDGVFMLT